MSYSPKTYRFILSGGGTGGHIYPAIAIAQELQSQFPECEILFVGAENKMEMRLVPEAGYSIQGLPIVGFNRTNLLSNISLPFKLWKSLTKAKKILQKFNPDAVIGTGGFASGPLLKQAQKLGIPTFIQEQNAFAGITNKLLAKKAVHIFTAFEGMEKWFPSEKITITGNPVRRLNQLNITQAEAKEQLGFEAQYPLVFVTGGSLGAVVINRAIGAATPYFVKNEVQLLWQCGRNNYKHLKGTFGEAGMNWKLQDFVSRMDLAFHAADLVVSRAGASTISELALVGKPAILIPSPNVAEDHQTYNAKAVEKAGGALFLADEDVAQDLHKLIFKTVENTALLHQLSEGMLKFGQPEAAQKIVSSIKNNLKP